MGVLPKHVVDEYLNRELRDSSTAKLFTDEQLDEKILALDPLPEFETEPFWHQKIVFLLMLKYQGYELLLDMGLGKALPVDELVLTPQGARPIGELRVGDFVVGSSGRPTLVTGVFPQGIRDVYKVRFSDGAQVRCTEDHLWTVHTPARVSKTKPLKELIGDLRYTKSTGQSIGNRKWFVPMISPVHFDSGDKPHFLHPYVLGVMLGDGCIGLNNCSFSNSDTDIIEKVRSLLPPKCGLSFHSNCDGCMTFGFVGNQSAIPKELSRLGLRVNSSKKFVPECYLYSSPENRLQLLQGLMDTDGCTYDSGMLEFGSISKNLAESVQFLIRSLGGNALFWTGVCKWKGTEKPVYSVTGRLPKNLEAFSCQRKAEKRNRGKLDSYRAFTSIEKEREAPCVCISVEASDGLFATKDFVLTHNSKCVLDAFRYFQKKHGIKRLLIQVPNVVNIGEWASQVRTHAPSLRYEGLLGSVEEKTNQLQSTADVVCGTYMGILSLMSDTVPRRKVKKGQGSNMWVINDKKVRELGSSFDMVVYDESTEIKNPQGLPFKLAKKLINHIPFRYGLAGRPMGKNPIDLWSQFYAIDEGETLGPTLGLFRGVFFIEKKSYFGPWFDYKYNEDMNPELNRMLRNRSIEFDRSECQDLPPEVRIRKEITFPFDTWKQYQALIDELRASKGNFTLVDNVYLRMRQITAGFLSFKDREGGSHEVIFKENPKLDALIFDIQAAPTNAQIIVFNDYVKTGEIVCERLKKEKIKHVRLYGATKDKNSVVEKFKTDPSVKVIVLNSDSGSMGLNLQNATYVFFYESPVSPITRSQAEARAIRTGQKSTVFIHDYVVNRSVDGKILKSLETGNNLHDQLVRGNIDELLE